eukprot:CAMPEP_0170566760 /NCGR_PEP_ID=MMETSP0211-20121228/80043_1 /TAXON_ID=311385 /ORGANISM="Pseudokeronopsis sp., Strain OXSARD2" /LENGTH=169 /DNA_ID=CAMNT_0010888021 /DNA_START=285 /DNA_END=794 /DNA_ORIENTATION=-
MEQYALDLSLNQDARSQLERQPLGSYSYKTRNEMVEDDEESHYRSQRKVGQRTQQYEKLKRRRKQTEPETQSPMKLRESLFQSMARTKIGSDFWKDEQTKQKELFQARLEEEKSLGHLENFDQLEGSQELYTNMAQKTRQVWAPEGLSHPQRPLSSVETGGEVRLEDEV